MIKYRVKSSLRPALFLGVTRNRIVGGTIEEVNGQVCTTPYYTVPATTTLDEIEWLKDNRPPKATLKEWKVPGSKPGSMYTVRETPSGRLQCECFGYQYYKKCKHTTKVQTDGSV